MLGSRCLLSAAFTTISSKILYRPGTYVTGVGVGVGMAVVVVMVVVMMVVMMVVAMVERASGRKGTARGPRPSGGREAAACKARRPPLLSHDGGGPSPYASTYQGG